MSNNIKITFAKSSTVKGGLSVLLAGKGGQFSQDALSADPDGITAHAMKVAEYDGKKFSALDLLVPEGSPADRLAVIGLGDPGELQAVDWLRVGGAILGQAKKARQITVFADMVDVELAAGDLANVALGILMRSYRFDAYKTKDNGSPSDRKDISVTIVSQHAAAAKKALADVKAIAEGVALARDCVNEPANVLGPVEFAKKAKDLEKLGVEVEILTEKEMKKLGMGALLGVAQGSVRPPRLAVMQWKGGSQKQQPIAFIGKGVVFDTGGISLKPGAGMEDMKGDMGGAAAVIGLMHTLAARKAKANVVGILGLVENMPDGNAQRPGDIVRSMSGQTIEIINTDAEGRLVLCDALWYCRDRFDPQLMINLATLTGAIVVALGHHYAGLFSNNDGLSEGLTAAGIRTDETVWRMPLGTQYDKLIDSKFADMKNTGGRVAGSITAAQFLQRFVGDTPWAHLDIAGTATGTPQSEVNRSWGSGFGVRLLDEFIRANHES